MIGPRFTLFTNWYRDSLPARQDEIVETLGRNLAHPLIERIVLFADPPATHLPPFESPKLVLVPRQRRTTFQEMFAYVNAELRPGSLAVVANADIYFDESLGLVDPAAMDSTLLALTRYDVDAGRENARLFRHRMLWNIFSQDAWIFKAPLAPIDAPFCPGIPGCDGRLAFEAHRSGLTVVNPCRSVRALHLHLIQKRNYGSADLLQGDYRALLETDWEQVAAGTAPSGIDFPVSTWEDLVRAYHLVGAGQGMAAGGGPRTMDLIWTRLGAAAVEWTD